MKFVKFRDIRMYHDITDGESVGWVVEFTAHYPKRGAATASVVAYSPTGRAVRDPHKVSQIMPVEDWPEFARKTLDTKGVEGHTQEELF